MSKDKARTDKKLILRGLLFSIFFSLPSIIDYFISNGWSHFVFADWDEPFYLLHHLLIGRASLADLTDTSGLRDLPPALKPMLTLSPHVAVDIIFGRIHNFLGLKTTTITVYLDLITVWASYVLFTWALRQICKKRIVAETASIALLTLPSLSGVDSLIQISWPSSSHFISTPFIDYVCPPVIRAVYTQLSYPLFALALFFLFRGLSQSPWDTKDARRAGIVTGSTIYIYFFAWGSLAPMLILTAFFLYLWERFATHEKPVASFRPWISAFLLPFSLISLPGILVFALNPARNELVLPESLTGYWNLQLGVVLTSVAIAIYLGKFVRTKHTALLCAWGLACYFSEIPLTNLQPLLGKLLTPYHFVSFYLRPAATAFLVILILDRSFHKYLLWLAAVIIGFKGISRYYWPLFEPTPKSEEIIELSKFLSTTKEDSVVWIYPFLGCPNEAHDKDLQWRILPYWVGSISQRQIAELSQLSSDSEEYVQREFLYGWIYNGIPQLTGYCPKSLPDVPQDLFTGIHSFQLAKRKSLCEQEQDHISRFDLCKSLKSNKVDIVVWETQCGPAEPGPIFRQVWASKEREFLAFSVDQEALLRTACGEVD